MLQCNCKLKLAGCQTSVKYTRSSHHVLLLAILFIEHSDSSQTFAVCGKPASRIQKLTTANENSGQQGMKNWKISNER
jgi:hypothetical protein